MNNIITTPEATVLDAQSKERLTAVITVFGAMVFPDLPSAKVVSTFLDYIFSEPPQESAESVIELLRKHR